MIRNMYSFKKISAATQTSHECLRWQLVRYLRDHYGTTHNQSVMAVNQFEGVSIDGVGKTVKNFTIFLEERL